MHTLEKARTKDIPSELGEREAFVEKAIAEFNAELKSALAAEQALRALQAQMEYSNTNMRGSHPLFDIAPNFWRVTAYGLFSSSVSTVSRMFDNKKGHGLQWCLGVCYRCHDVFSQEATAARMNCAEKDLPSYVAPDREYFEELYQATKPCWEYFYQYFHPMRNYWIGHRVLADNESAEKLADNFKDADIDAFFGRLAKLDQILQECFHRGKRLPVRMMEDAPNFNAAIRHEVDQLFSSTERSR